MIPGDAPRTRPPPEEIPQLKAMGLTCVDTAGAGNCLFHALSDQLYGNQMHHVQLRSDTVEYMRQHPEEFKRFVTVHPGGGIRRNPKRKTTSSLRHHPHHYTAHRARGFESELPSEADIERAFALSLDLMARGGTYGDNAEIIAFARRFRVGIRIWHVANAAFYTIEGPLTANGETSASSPQFLYIVYHTYEHYSSVRNVDGPFEGPPRISPQVITPEAQAQLQKELADGPVIHDWMVDLALESLPYSTNRNMVVQTLKQCKGNINLAVEFLLPESSTATSDRSSSVEPETERVLPANKRRGKPRGRPHPLRNDALPMRSKARIESHRVPMGARTTDGGHKSPDPRRLALALKCVDRQGQDPEETEEEDWRDDKSLLQNDAGSIGSTSTSEYSDPSQALSFAPRPRFRLSQPRRPVDPGTVEISSQQPMGIGGLRTASCHSSDRTSFDSSISFSTSPAIASSPESRIASPYKAARILSSPQGPRTRTLLLGAPRASDLVKQPTPSPGVKQENAAPLGFGVIQI